MGRGIAEIGHPPPDHEGTQGPGGQRQPNPGQRRPLKEIATRPKASAAWAITPSVVSMAQPLAASVETVSAMASATASVPTPMGSPDISASATPSTAAWAVASPK